MEHPSGLKEASASHQNGMKKPFAWKIRLWRFMFSPLGLRILLPLIDTITDLYTTYRYSQMKSQWRNVAFYGILSSLLFHNLVSAIYGYWSISKVPLATSMSVRKQNLWRCVALLMHLFGLGTIFFPLGLLLSTGEMDDTQFKLRYI